MTPTRWFVLAWITNRMFIFSTRTYGRTYGRFGDKLAARVDISISIEIDVANCLAAVATQVPTTGDQLVPQDHPWCLPIVLPQCYEDQAVCQCEEGNDDWEVGSPGNNGIDHVKGDLNTNLVQAYHMFELSRKADDGNICNIEGWQLENAIVCADPGNGMGRQVSQRSEGHGSFAPSSRLLGQSTISHPISGKLSKEEKGQAN